jgi:uncharacterized membrane protein YebE (DUF533 family)
MRKNLLGTIAEILTHPRNFPKFASVVMLTSGMIGFGVMKVVANKREGNVRQHDNLEQLHDRPMSQDESLVRAMIENAKSSTPMENLENAVTAQNNFMIPFHGEQDTKLFTRIKGKSKEIRQASEEFVEDSK